MNPLRRILGDRQAAGLLVGILAYFLIAQAALAGAVCSMAAAPIGDAGEVICTFHGPEGGSSPLPVHDCQCLIGCQHCAPTVAFPAMSDASVPDPGKSPAWSIRPAEVAFCRDAATNYRHPRAPPPISV